MQWSPTGGDHLDVRYYPDSPSIGRLAADLNADNPGFILQNVNGNHIYSATPTILNSTDQSLSGGKISLNLESDNGTSFGNPSGLSFFDFGVAIDRAALNIKYIQVLMTGIWAICPSIILPY